MFIFYIAGSLLTRLNNKQLDRLKKKYNVDRIWSFSRINAAESCFWDYWARYVKHMKLDSSSVYTEWGTNSHDLVQEYVIGNIDAETASQKWLEYVESWERDPTAFQFDTQKIERGYLNNLRHYFNHLSRPAISDVQNEKPVLIRIGKKKDYIFVGYIDTQYVDENGNTVLVDYKTSSKSSFSKAKLPEKSRQLMLYAIGKHQYSGIPYEKIKCRFDMMKYLVVHYRQENGKWNTSVQERSKWVSKMEKKLAIKLKKLGIDETKAEELIQIASMNNTLEDMPEEIQSQFNTSNYYIDIPVSEELCKKVANEIADDCADIENFEQMSPEDQEAFLELNFPYNPDNYYDKKLCAYHRSDYFKEREALLNSRLQPEADDMDDLFKEDQLVEELFS